MSKKRDTWWKACNEWLLSNGYILIYDNHPSKVPREFHWCKDGVRICCVSEWDICVEKVNIPIQHFPPEYYLYADIFMPKYSLHIQSQRFIFPHELMEALPSFIETKLKIEKP
jgi:hypothetical protein